MPNRTSPICLALIAYASAVVSMPATAAELCKSRVHGVGTGSGTFGQGSKKARARAIENWETAAGVRFGSRYARFDHAVEPKWDCRVGVLQAKCVVTAVACR